MRILKTVVKRKLAVSKNSNVLIKIDIREYSPVMLRDMLIALNKMGNLVLSSKSRIINLSLHICGDVLNSELGDIFTCCRMNPFVGDIHFELAAHAQTDNSIDHRPNNDKPTVNLHVDVTSDEMDLQLEGMNDVRSVRSNCLSVSQLSTRVWAMNVLKTFKPGSFIVCFDVPGYIRENDVGNFTVWREFFLQVWETFPCVHFLLLNYSLECGKGFAVELPNVTITKMQGYNLLEEFALVQTADMFMGSYDKYAAIVIGSEKPLLLFGLNENDRNSLVELIAPDSQLLLARKDQLLISDDLLPDSLYSYFKRFYMGSTASGRGVVDREMYFT